MTDAAVSQGSGEYEESLPEWNLDDLYTGPDADQLEADTERAFEAALAFRHAYEGRLKDLSGKEMGEAIQAYEAIAEIVYKILSYAQLLHAANVGNQEIGRFYQTTQEKVTEIEVTTLFFTLELNKLDDDVLAEQLKDSVTKRYTPWVQDNRLFRKHQLSDDLEKILHEKVVTGHTAWTRLFEETMAGLRFQVDGEKLTVSETLNLLTDKKDETRKKAAKAFGKGLGENIQVFSLVTNTLAKDKEIEDQWRGYATPVSKRNLQNQIEDEVVEALVNAVKDAYDELAHRYYLIKAKWFGVEKLDYWDRNAPLLEDNSAHYTWGQAKDTVLNAYQAFEPKMAEIAEQFFDKNWIDAGPRENKDSGAFSHPTVPSAHPYILMNFHGRSRDVMTLAHELGHGVHQVLSAEQGCLLADTPLTLAETASVFGEMLTFRTLLDGESDAEKRRILLAGKVEDMMNTVVRQISFHDFEHRVHSERPNGELSPDRLGEIWMDVQRESLGPAFRFDEEYKNYWAYIPHFVHTPFYVYAYAFGDCLVNSLYDVYQKGFPDFQAKYLEMLSAGGTLRHKEILQPFGLDAGDPNFWRRGLDVVSGFIDELEKTP